MKKVLCLMLAIALILTTFAIAWANNMFEDMFSNEFANFEEFMSVEDFMEVREEIMFEQRQSQERTTRFIVRYRNEEAQQEAEPVIQRAFDRGRNRNDFERRELESRIDRFSGTERAELEMFAEYAFSRSETERRPVRANFERSTVSDSSISFGRTVRRTTSLTELIVLDEAVNPQDFIENIMAEMGNSIEFIQEDIRMELSDFMRFELDLSSDFELDFNLDSDLDLSFDLNFEFENELTTNDFMSSETIVAVIDTGIDVTHSSLAGRLVDGFDFVNNTSNVFNPDLGAEQNHGTHIAGIIAQTAPNARIMPLKVFENGMAYTSDIIAAIQFAEANGATIVNASWGATGYNPALREVIENSPMFFVAAAGNHRVDLNETPIYPASFDLPNVISVASVNQDLGMSFFSNFGSVDIAAIGRDVSSTVVGGGFGTMTGTSVSAAFVSAAAVMTDSEDIKSALMTSADKLSHLHGRVRDGNFLNIDNLLNGVAGQFLTVDYEDDFDRWFERTPEESWELFNASPTIQVVAGIGHTVALKSNGTVWAWGANGSGQLGIGTSGANVNRNIPTQVIGLDNVKFIAAADSHTFAIRENGDIYAWGSNGSGQFGNGTTTFRTIPTPTGLSGFATIVAGSSHTVAITENGYVYAWGSSSQGQLGDGTTTTRLTPVRVRGLGGVGFLTNIQAIATGSAHTVALTENGDVYAWGWNSTGQLGDDTITRRLTPVQVSGPGGAGFLANVQAIGAGGQYTVALTINGDVHTWGSNSLGHLGDGNTTNRNTPTPTPVLSGVETIISGSLHTFAIKENGDIYAWGANGAGQLGAGNNINSHVPILINFNFSSEIKEILVGRQHTVALTENGDIYTWGQNNSGQLGIGVFSIWNITPQRIGFNIFYRETVSLGINAVANRIHNVIITGEHITRGNREVTVRFNPEHLRVEESWAQTYTRFINYGLGERTDVNVVEFNPNNGLIRFELNYNTANGRTFSGIPILVRFVGRQTVDTVVEMVI